MLKQNNCITCSNSAVGFTPKVNQDNVVKVNVVKSPVEARQLHHVFQIVAMQVNVVKNSVGSNAQKVVDVSSLE